MIQKAINYQMIKKILLGNFKILKSFQIKNFWGIIDLMGK